MVAAIRADNLGKAYQMTEATGRAGYRTLRESLMSALAAPFRRRQTAATEPFWALKDLDFEVPAGQMVGIIGRNGAGKSTLLKILSQITKPTTGRVEINGRVGSLLEVGTGFHQELTGRENIYLNGSILGMRRREIDRKFDEIVAFAEVEQFLDTPVKRYSSGMYVRLAFAVAAHLEPEILIVDEVLAVGDAAFQKKCLGKMKEVGNSGRTVLFVSHNIDIVLALCQRCIVLRKGNLYLDGPPSEAIPPYLNDALASRDGRFELRNHAARLPAHETIITQIELSGPQGATSVFCTNDPFAVTLTLDATREMPDPRIAVAVEDHYGRRLFTVASYFQKPIPVTVRKEPTRITCRIPRLRLGAGRYLISVSIADRYAGLLDSVDGAGWFEVESHDAYGCGEAYSPVYGPMLEDAIWANDD